MNWRLSWVPFGALLVILPYPGTVAARLLLLLLTFACAVAWHRMRPPPRRAPLPCLPALALWWLVGGLSLAYAADPAYSLGELKNEIGYTMLALFAFFVIGQDRHMARFGLRAAVVGALVLCAWGLATWVRGGFAWHVAGRHGGVGVVSTFVVTVLPALLVAILTDPARSWRRLGALAVGMSLLTALATAQRAAIPAIAVEAAIGLAFLIRSPGASLTRAQVLALAAGGCAAVGLAALWYSRIRYGDGSGWLAGDTRIAFWPTLAGTILADPLLGAGFGRQAMKIAHPELIPGYNRELWHAHNVVLNYGIGMGVPGMVALLALFGAWGRFFWRHVATPAGVGGVMLVAGVFLRNQFNDFFQRDMSLLFWALCGMFAGMLLARDADGA